MRKEQIRKTLLNGVFREDGIDGMRGVANQKLGMILPFISAITDLICSTSESCPVTTVFTEYVDVMNKICGRNGREKWIVSDITKLRSDK